MLHRGTLEHIGNKGLVLSFALSIAKYDNSLLPGFCFPWIHLTLVNSAWKYYVENYRNKLFVSFQLYAILSSMTNVSVSHSVWTSMLVITCCTLSMLNTLLIHHLVAVLVTTESIVAASRCFCLSYSHCALLVRVPKHKKSYTGTWDIINKSKLLHLTICGKDILTTESLLLSVMLDTSWGGGILMMRGNCCR